MSNTKKNSFKIGDFVEYSASDDGDKLSTYWSFAEVVGIDENGMLTLQPYNMENYDEVTDVDPKYCDKLDHFAGLENAHTLYTGGKYNIYAGYHEFFITKKELGKPYVFQGTIDEITEYDEVIAYHDDNVMFDRALTGELAEKTCVCVESDNLFVDLEDVAV